MDTTDCHRAVNRLIHELQTSDVMSRAMGTKTARTKALPSRESTKMMRRIVSTLGAPNTFDFESDIRCPANGTKQETRVS